ncbi:MAG: SEC-C domain-containing protein [Myxococcota bacterium]|nr:SEC-C domain-containing protein [Myxococcota bacterium]
MSHDLHFLERLSRVTEEDRGLALSLYYDPQLVREIVALAPMPDDAERLALALWFEPEGPHVVVNREGHFVTCLGEGMSTGELPILTRHQLEGIKLRAARIRDAIRVATPENIKRCHALFRRIDISGHNLFREDFQLAATLAPLAGLRYLSLSLHAGRTALELRQSIAGILRSASLKRARDREQVLLLYQLYWASAHYAVLTALNPAELSALPREIQDDLLLAWAGIRSSNLGVLVRSLWATGRAGKPMMPSLRRAWAACLTPNKYYLGVFGMLAVALRHSSFRAEVLRAFKRKELPPTASPYFDAMLPRECCPILQEQASRVILDELPGLKDAYLKIFKDAVPPESWEAFCVDGELAPDLRDFFLSGHDCIFSFPADTPLVLLLLSSCLGFSPERLYLPRVYCDKMREIPDAFLLAFMREQSLQNATPSIVRKASEPGRNQPCSCGSGRKYKHCCMNQRPEGAS